MEAFALKDQALSIGVKCDSGTGSPNWILSDFDMQGTVSQHADSLSAAQQTQPRLPTLAQPHTTTHSSASLLRFANTHFSRHRLPFKKDQYTHSSSTMR